MGLTCMACPLVLRGWSYCDVTCGSKRLSRVVSHHVIEMYEMQGCVDCALRTLHGISDAREFEAASRLGGDIFFIDVVFKDESNI